MKLHHLGIAVKDIKVSILHYTTSLGWANISEIILDPIQNVNIQFMCDANNNLYELIEPIDKTSPVSNLLSKRISLYHLCYEVDNINLKIQDLEKTGFIRISGPVNAVAFNDRYVAFLINQDNLTIELLEK